jgi:hypothetical protein
LAVEKKQGSHFPHHAGLLSIGITSLLITAFEIHLLKSARFKWAQISQQTKALRLSHRVEYLFLDRTSLSLFQGVSARAPS